MGLVALLAKDADRGGATLGWQLLAKPMVLQVAGRSTDIVILNKHDISASAAECSRCWICKWICKWYRSQPRHDQVLVIVNLAIRLPPGPLRRERFGTLAHISGLL